jgi:hypothetical protein
LDVAGKRPVRAKQKNPSRSREREVLEFLETTEYIDKPSIGAVIEIE